VKAWFRLAGVLVVLAAAPAAAHELRPGYLEIRETAPDRYRVLWKQPARGDFRLAIDPVFPASCRVEGERVRQALPNAFLDRMTIVCEGGLGGKTMAVAGLEATLTDVLVRIQLADGRAVTELLKPRRPSLTVPAAGAAAAAMAYLRLGVEHIVLGIDHLLFVLGLLLLVTGPRRLLQTVTAFTVGHSLSLALAALGAVDVPAPPLDAAIALSIVFLAAEIVRARRGERTLATRQPAIVAGLFGLVHGLGFATALTGLGLPPSALPTVLLLFNVGVEIGQIAFIAMVLGVVASWRALGVRWPAWAAPVPIYAMGVAAAAWFAERLSGLVGG
jgi:hydrogenase/urease accessory protein HupE